ncbi:hypothetical protein Ciccas_012650 [Cichlidogyrus casuarinus]|uniref:Peptidase C1A papain C-terminal domain-containing protein n=1 Tax=Cichlidogyrus casuarinus TaxID=1844966 RepID=A0ABD2PST7_9PLAT
MPMNHGVAVMGYGTDSKLGQDYILVQNSVGTNWGENGFFRLPLGEDICKIQQIWNFIDVHM